MHLPDIDPVLLHLGPVQVHWYALAYIAGIVFGWLYARHLLRQTALWAPRQPPLTAEQLDDLILWLIIGIILGGRIGYLLAYNASIIWTKPLDALKIWEGGMSFHGGFTGVLIATVIFCRRNKFTLPQMLNLGDLLASAAPLGLFFGRIANFVNGELWGRPTSLPWGIVFCNQHIRDQYREQYKGECPANLDSVTGTFHDIARHPSQLYEALGEGVILFAVIWFLGVNRHKLKKPGLIFGIFALGYGIIRILLENVRTPDEQMLPFFKNVITMGELLSLPMVIGGAWLIWRAMKTPDEPVDPAVEEKPASDTPETAA
jgi:phosphatidylglycerol:prolipoprotein diacylglycerol transferase